MNLGSAVVDSVVRTNTGDDIATINDIAIGPHRPTLYEHVCTVLTFTTLRVALVEWLKLPAWKS